MQNRLATLRSQGVTGVRFQFAFCGGFYSTPLVDGPGSTTSSCGTFNPPYYLNQTWANNVAAFLGDIANAHIQNVTLAPSHSGFGGDFLSPGVAPTPGPAGTICPGTPDTVYFWGAAPYPTVGDSMGGRTTPVGAGVSTAYNCASLNPYFVGWTNLYNVIDEILNRVPGGLTVFEIDIENELNFTDFTVMTRYLHDNASGQNPGDAWYSGNPDSLNTLRYAMGTAHAFDPGHVTVSVPIRRATATENGQPFDCVNVYQDWARLTLLDSFVSAVGSAYIGNMQPKPQSNLDCSGQIQSMVPSPYSWDPPTIIDVHDYACVENPATGQCSSSQTTANVTAESKNDFSDLVHFRAIVTSMQSALLVVGETHSNSSDNLNGGLTCEFRAPAGSASAEVTGYNNSQSAGGAVVFRPWANMTQACFNPTNLIVNSGSSGPYNPTQQ